ncbi:hypothetical protein AB0G85_31110 [Streptomyces sioyaensis]|uniref:hypothetical protein n=1 Tax=Streptomyces sioyaensis TaxID=67364 RepID=UPI0033E0897B
MSNDHELIKLTVARRKRSPARQGYRRIILALLVAASTLPPYEPPSTDLKILAWLLIALPVLISLYFVAASTVVRGILKSIFKAPTKDTLLTIK